MGRSFVIHLGCSLGVLLPGLPLLHQTSRLGAREAPTISVWVAQPVLQLLQAASVCSLRRRRNCPTALDINPYLFLIFPFYQRWQGEGESHCWLWNVPGSFAVAAKKQVSRRSAWAKIRGGGLGRPLVLWLRCWRALTSRSVGLFEGHVRRDVLWAPGEACHRRTDNR